VRTDPKSSYGDFAALSHPVGTELAELLTSVVCDGIIAPGYALGTVAKLRKKKNGRFLVGLETLPILEESERVLAALAGGIRSRPGCRGRRSK
jgi:AICAR transformylase/IMP cyclohydrolase PurH